MNAINTFTKKLSIVFFYIAMVLLIVIVALQSVEVISRYFFDYSFIWSHELSQLLVCWLIFLGFGKVFIDDETVQVTFVVDKLPEKFSMFIQGFCYLLLIGLSAYLFYVLFVFTGNQLNKTTEIMGFTKALYSIPFTLTMVIVFLGSIAKLIDMVKKSP